MAPTTVPSPASTCSTRPSIKGWTDDIAAASKQAAPLAQRELVAATGAKDRGIDARSDMTGFNWSDVPVILPEIGFMSNPAEDRLLATSAYQEKIVAGLTRAILAFLGAGRLGGRRTKPVRLSGRRDSPEPTKEDARVSRLTVVGAGTWAW